MSLPRFILYPHDEVVAQRGLKTHCSPVVDIPECTVGVVITTVFTSDFVHYVIDWFTPIRLRRATCIPDEVGLWLHE